MDEQQPGGGDAWRLAPPPPIATALPAEEALARLDRLAVRGRLPGFTVYPDSARFEVAVFAEPFDRALVAEIRKGEGHDHSIHFSLRLKTKAPLIFAIAIGLTIWPGVVLTDSLIPGAWGWWPTWQWYLPLVIVPLPFLLPRIWKKSVASGRDHLQEQYERVVAALEAAAETDAPSPARQTPACAASSA